MGATPPDETGDGAGSRYRAVLAQNPELAYPPGPGGLQLILGEAERRQAESAAAGRFSDSVLGESAFKTGVIAEDPYICLVRDAVRFPGGQLGTYIRILEKPFGQQGVAVLPLLGDRVVLLRHFRHATGRTHWEIPRGFAAEGEPWEETARREVREELGAELTELSRLGSVHPNTGLLAGQSVLALGKISGLGELERGEGITEHRAISADDAAAMCSAGDITDAFTLAALLHARLAGVI